MLSRANMLLLSIDTVKWRFCTIHNFLEPYSSSIHTSDLTKDVAPIVLWHLHTVVVVGESWTRHLESFEVHRAHTSEVGLIALVLQNGFLSLLNSKFFFHFHNHLLEEPYLVFLFLNFNCHLSQNLFLGSLWVVCNFGNACIVLECSKSYFLVAILNDEANSIEFPGLSIEFHFFP